jgi:hypothetical protein
MPALIRSTRPAAGSRNSGNSSGPRTSRRSITGTPIRNTEPHQNRSRRKPPTRGPIAAPAEKLAIHTPIATVRCLESRNMLRIRDSVDGARVAAAIPISAREAISISVLVDKAAATDMTPNAAAPISSSRRRPIRSPRVPIGIRNPASRNP